MFKNSPLIVKLFRAKLACIVCIDDTPQENICIRFESNDSRRVTILHLTSLNSNNASRISSSNIADVIIIVFRVMSAKTENQYYKLTFLYSPNRDDRVCRWPEHSSLQDSKTQKSQKTNKKLPKKKIWH